MSTRGNLSPHMSGSATIFRWTVSQVVEAALIHTVPVIIILQKSRNELDQEYDATIVDQFLGVWSALSRVIQSDSSLLGILMRAKSLTDTGHYRRAWSKVTAVLRPAITSRRTSSDSL